MNDTTETIKRLESIRQERPLTFDEQRELAKAIYAEDSHSAELTSNAWLKADALIRLDRANREIADAEYEFYKRDMRRGTDDA